MQRIPLTTHLILMATALLMGCNPATRNGSTLSHNYDQAMRDLVIEISRYAKSENGMFIVVAQNGLPLLTTNKQLEGAPARDYLAALDGVGQEHLFYGLPEYGAKTKGDYRLYLAAFMHIAQESRLTPMVIDYVSQVDGVEDSYLQNFNRRFLSFAAASGNSNLDRIPEVPPVPFAVSPDPVTKLSHARNFLYLLNSAPFRSKRGYLKALRQTHYDLMVIDPYHKGTTPLTRTDVVSLQGKPGGARRLVLAYVNIGAAESFRYYWREGWGVGNPPWLAAPYSDPAYENEYWVKYWDDAWHRILFGGTDSYIGRIIAAGFDGVYLDNIEAFRYFEEKGVVE